jgi:hypothetical protein
MYFCPLARKFHCGRLDPRRSALADSGRELDRSLRLVGLDVVFYHSGKSRWDWRKMSIPSALLEGR